MVDLGQPAKTCGACTQCCKVLVVEALSKPSGKWCDHCTPGRGCNIYAQRPAACQTFNCQWLREPSLAAKYRPDRCKVVLVADHGGARLFAICDPNNPLAWRRQPIYGLLKQQAAAGWASGAAVMAKAGERLWFIAPAEDIDLGIVDLRSPFEVTRRKDGTATVIVLPPAAHRDEIAPMANPASRGP